MSERKTIQDVFIRVCRDSGFGLDATRAAQLAGGVVGVSPMEVLIAIGSTGTMKKIAGGLHPACFPTPTPTHNPEGERDE